MTDPTTVILGLCFSLLGQDGQGAPLLVLREDGWHAPRCQRRMFVHAGDSLRGGADCSDRCRQTNAAIDAAEQWLREQAGDTLAEAI